MKRKMFIVMTVLWMYLFVAAACSSTTAQEGEHDPDDFRVMVFAEVPDWFEEVVEDDIRSLLEAEGMSLDVHVDVMIPSYDKLTIEIINKKTDFFVVEKRLEQILLDPYGLAVLDELMSAVPEGVDYQEYILYSEDEKSDHLYGIPFDKTWGLLRDTGVILEEPLVAGVVGTSPHQKSAKKLLEYWLHQ